jgi:membrane-associated phospholipid phosphatase
MEEIVTQVTLPYSYFAAVLNLQPGRHRFTYELLAAVWRLSTLVVMQFKHRFGIQRPADRSPLVQPVLLTPGHGAYPAGHATQAHFAAEVLKQLLGIAGAQDDRVEQLDRLAARIAENRVVAGLHFKEDIDAGRTLGEALAGYFCDRCELPAATQNTPAPAPGDETAVQWLWQRAKEEWA